MQPDPARPAFETGQRVRYIGTRQAYRNLENGGKDWIKRPGMIVTISETVPGRRGTGAVLMIDDDGDEMIDTTKDGYNVYEAGGQGWIIWPEYAHEWELVE